MMRVLCLFILVCGCSGPTSPDTAIPTVRHVHVDENASATGVTVVQWWHRDGADALDPTTASAVFMDRTSDGSSESRTHTPASRTVREDGVVELRFADGRGVPVIRISHADIRGRWLTADCIGPLWRCETVRALSYPAIPLP